jgi:tight adherence protein C
VSGLFLFAAAWEIAGLGSARVASRLISPRSRDADLRDALAARLAIHPRLARAGLAEAVSARSFVVAKLGSGLAGAVFALAVVPGPVGRLGLAMIAGMGAAGFVAPDAWAERRARRRRRRIAAALPDALDLVAVGVAAGRTPVALLGEIARGTLGPLAEELALSVAEIDAGARQAAALTALRERTGAPELGSLTAALERSRRYGSPLAEQLHAQAGSLRAEEQRRIAESAARAAPKIQLVVAMVLVPSALLAIAAALVANSDSLFAAI